MSTPTKPERVEVGQRWGIAGLGGSSLVERIDGERADFENGWNGLLRLMLDPSYGGWVYLGPATPGTATVMPMAEAPDGYPVGCLLCGKTLGSEDAYECEAHDEGGYYARTRDWRAGKRDFPRRPVATVTPSKPSASPALQSRPHPADLLPSKAPVYGRLVGELRAPDGTPRTALEAIQAKREPERWVPSCDIDCDIPDADEGWRR